MIGAPKFITNTDCPKINPPTNGVMVLPLREVSRGMGYSCQSTAYLL